MKKIISAIFNLWIIVISLLSIFDVDFKYRRQILYISILVLIITEIYKFLKPKLKS